MEGDEDVPEWMMDAGGGGKGAGKGAADRNKKRFSEDQIKSLESMFATQTKLEPRQKLQLARELGLQPRQVAIWFQNKRARWKSKQLEREYSALRDDYDALLCSYESLKKEKHALLKQLEKLAEMLQEPPPKYSGNADAGAGDHSLKGMINGTMKEEFSDVRPAPYSSVEGGGGGASKFSHFADDDAGGLFRPSPQPSAGFTASGPPEHQPFQFHSSSCWPSSAGQTTCSSSQWWEFESLSE